MDKQRKRTYELLKKNANELRNVLKQDDFNLAEADKLFRERNSLFRALKDVLTSKDVADEELNLIQDTINDNNELLQLMEKKREGMEKNFKKKELEAKKITSYLKG